MKPEHPGPAENSNDDILENKNHGPLDANPSQDDLNVDRKAILLSFEVFLEAMKAG
ncbi:MAG: hypothetical protein WCJ84_02995 [Candidatus Peregrinibacteria bacterium]